MHRDEQNKKKIGATGILARRRRLYEDSRR